MLAKLFGKKWYQRYDEKSKFMIDKQSISFVDNVFKAELENSSIELTLYFFQDGCVRIRYDLSNEATEYKRFDLSKSEIIIDQEKINIKAQTNIINYEDKSEMSLNDLKVVIFYNPFKIEIFKNEKLLSTVNEDEHFMIQTGNEHTVITDLSFHGENIKISGLAERVTPNNLNDGVYQMFNVDAYGFDDKKISSIYGNIPFVLAHSPDLSVGAFWMNASETHVNIQSKENCKNVTFLSEGGYNDILIFVKEPLEIIKSYCSITGNPMMPPLWTLGYHQCRWGYKTQAMCEEVMAKLDEAGIPFDCFWLDLDHLKDRSPWHYDEKKFPNAQEMEKKSSKMADNS